MVQSRNMNTSVECKQWRPVYGESMDDVRQKDIEADDYTNHQTM